MSSCLKLIEGCMSKKKSNRNEAEHTAIIVHYRMDNKRKHKRFETCCEIEYYVNSQAYKGISRDLSLKGLFIETDKALDADSVIDIQIYLPNGSTAKLKGRIRTTLQKSGSRIPADSSKQGMGVEIIEQDVNYSRFITAMYVQHTLSLRNGS